MIPATRRFLWIPVLVLAAAGCSSKEESADLPNVQLMKTDMQFSRAVAVQGLLPVMEMYLDDEAVQLPPNSLPLVGKDAILEQARQTLVGHVTRTPMKAETSASGDFGYTWGSAQITVNYPNGATVVQSAKYVTVWKKTSDGQWKIVADISNQTPVPTET